MLALLTQSSVRLSLALAVTALAVVPRADAQNGTTIDSRLYEGLTWQNLGPFRAGRVAAVSGPIGQPVVFYIGLPAAGVWQTGRDRDPNTRHGERRVRGEGSDDSQARLAGVIRVRCTWRFRR